MTEIVRARAPLRIGLAGGGTDVNPYASERGGYVFNTTINKYAFSTLKPRRDKNMSVTSEYYGRYKAPLDGGPLPLDGNMDLIKAVANYFFDSRGFEPQGFDLSIRSDVPAGSGLGGSSTMIVSMIEALANWLDVDMSKVEMAQLAYHLEREVIGLKGGMQDQYAAVFGGFNSLKIDKNGVNVLPAHLSQDIVNELQCRSVMCFTGMTHDSAAIIETQVKTYREGKNDDALDKAKDIAIRFRSSLRHGDIDDCGRLLGESWEYKKRFSNKISNPEIDDLYNAAVKAGAIGGKVSGAGGGGFMYFICGYDKKPAVTKALAAAGATISNFMFEPNGVTSWRSNYD
ncbi:putative kinase (galactokinase and mevalonate kinase -like protein) [Thermoplasmatales archaeon BRNA1]|nr:putative kinase (galactokinase and mevalonate kinase -like protein) [Thermoplasmatales archaeon BRNA1]